MFTLRSYLSKCIPKSRTKGFPSDSENEQSGEKLSNFEVVNGEVALPLVCTQFGGHKCLA